MPPPSFTDIAPPERGRRYVFPDGCDAVFTNVHRLAVGKSGTHRLECDQGHIIVAPGWRYIELDIDDWTL